MQATQFRGDAEQSIVLQALLTEKCIASHPNVVKVQKTSDPQQRSSEIQLRFVQVIMPG